MFLQLERQIHESSSPVPGVGSVFDLSPTQLIGRLEQYWADRYLGWDHYAKSSDQISSQKGSANPRPMPDLFRGLIRPHALSAHDAENKPYDLTVLELVADPYHTPRRTAWDHLVFAYLLETTYLYEIFARVVFDYTSGVRRDVLEPDAIRWLTSTESLFFTHPVPYSVLGITSDLHPEIRGVRATDYARMFGLPVNHPVWDGRPYPRAVAGSANVDFAPTLEEFLREAWIGVVNVDNQSGAKDTDDAAIARLARRLYDMLVTTRRYGSLDRREFVHVSTMSWFYLTLLSDSPIIRQLKAEGSSPYERLQNVADRVGMKPHTRTEQFFALADSLPVLLRVLETGRLNTSRMAPAVYLPGSLGQVVRDVTTHWSIASGHDLKAAITTPGRIRSEIGTGRAGTGRPGAIARPPAIVTAGPNGAGARAPARS